MSLEPQSSAGHSARPAPQPPTSSHVSTQAFFSTILSTLINIVAHPKQSFAIGSLPGYMAQATVSTVYVWFFAGRPGLSIRACTAWFQDSQIASKVPRSASQQPSHLSLHSLPCNSPCFRLILYSIQSVWCCTLLPRLTYP